jgi:2'-5' RNA ligase
MPHSIMAFFDSETEAAIQKIWKELDETGAAPYLHRSANRPHFKLAIYEDLDITVSQQRLRSIATTTARIPVHFKSLGIFPNLRPTVFLAPAVTPNLLVLQNKVAKALNNFGKCPPYDYFSVDHWVPHCLLGFDLEPENLADVLACALHLQLPFDGLIKEIGLVEFHPVKHLFTFPLPGND